MTSSLRLPPVTSLLAVVLLLATAARICDGFSMPGFSPVYNPCSPAYSLERMSSGGAISMEVEGGASTYDPDTMYQVTLTSSEAFNYVVINGVLLTSENQEQSRGDDVESRGTMTSCALIYTFMSPVPMRSLSFFYMSPPSGSGCTLLTAMASTWNRMVQAEVPVIRLCESPPRISTTFSNLNLNQGISFYDNFDSGPLQQKWNSEESSIESATSCGDIASGNALIFCAGTSGSITSHPIDLTSATYLKFTMGQGTCDGNGKEIHIFYRDSSSSPSSWNLLQSVQYYSESGESVQQLIEIPAEAKSSQVELKLSTNEEEQLLTIRSSSKSKQLPVSRSSCVAIDDVIITTSDQLPVEFYEDFESDDQLNWLWSSNSRASPSSCGRDDVIMVDGSGDGYLMTRDLDLSGGGGVRTHVNDITPKSASFGGSGSCSHDANVVLVFDLQGKREVCTSIDLSGVAALQFVLSIGNPACAEKAASKYSTGDVDLFFTSGDSRDVIRTFDPADFRDPTKVLVHLPGRLRTTGGSLCLGQLEAKSRYQDVWAMDSFHVIASADVTPPTSSQYFAQFSFNLNCDDVGGAAVNTKLDFQYSNDLGKTWDTVHSECLPETCFGNHFIFHTVFESSQFSDWTRVSFPLPQAALSSTTRFKWIETSPEKKSSRSWSIDDVFIGSSQLCPGFCSGHGSCTPGGCFCDDGYTGESCDEPTFQLIDFLSDSFTGNEINQTHFSQVRGAEIGFSCGIVAFGKSLIFNKKGIRSLTTQPIDARELKFLQFAVVMGRNSLTGSCRAPDQAGEGVLVQYSINGGITWKLLELIPFNFYREPSIVSLPLPEEASKLGLLIRWYQPSRDLNDDEGVWSIDDVIVSSKFFKTAYSQSVNFHLGQIQEFCDRFPVLAFTAEPTHGFEARYAETQSLQISSGYVLQADMVVGCHHHQDELHPMTQVELEYSTDHGKSWSLVYELSIPGSTTSSHYHKASIFHANEFHEWSRKTVPLPTNTWSESTRIRLIELGSDNVTDSWAVDNVYIGPGCPDMCHNHGYCEHGICTCEPGYSGPTCLPDQALPRGLDVAFDDVSKLKKAGWKIYGGAVVSPANDESAGCSAMTGSNFLHFNQQGVRLVMTPDMDTREGRQIQFYLQIGGGSCRVATGRGNGILLQFSTNGGNTWLPVQELYYDEYPRPTFVHLPLPHVAMTSHTRFRWWQPQHGGSDMDEWSIDDVIVGEVMMSDEVVQITSVSATSPQVHPAAQQQTRELRGSGNMVSAFLGFSNRGQAHEFCAPRKNALVFNGVKGDRFATTDDVFLTEADVIQYEINVGCTREFSYQSPVRLEFSHDGGMTWDFVRHSCYPRGQHVSLDHDDEHHNEDMTSHVCTGSARTLVESIRHHAGDYDVWMRVTIPVTKAISSKLVRFRWFQAVPTTDSSPASWAIDAVYVGRACPSNCHGHGACVKLSGSAQPKCACDNGYQETRDGSCQATKPHRSGMWEKFESKHRLPSDEWKRPHGGAISSTQPCGVVHEGNSLLFDGVGTRLAQTRSLDTSNTRLIQFYLRIGSTENTESCSTPTDRNEGIVFQYSTDNGITWNLIKEFSFKSHHGDAARLISIIMPYRAQTPYTCFRWWQPLALETDRRATWALDNIFVGRANMLSNGFYDDFDEYDVNDELGNENWYRVKAGEIDVSQDDCSLEEKKKVKGHSLILNSDPGSLGFVETWDFHLLSGTFLQFELKASCIDASEDQLRLEYSNDMGKSYQLVNKPCLTDFRAGCDYDTGSVYHASMNRKWTRHTVYLKEQIRTSSVRFRWIRFSTSGSNSSSEWAIDNIYLGNNCEWMCGGHGSCAPSGGSFTCKCDEGFSTSPHCQPSNPLDSEMQDTFDGGNPISDNFPTHIGAHISNDDVIVSGNNLLVAGAGTRLLDTRPLDTSDTKFIQLNLKFATEVANNKHVLVVQSSVNNGITWSTLSEIQPTVTTTGARFVHIELPAHARYQATNFRFFTPDLDMKANQVSWSIDDLYIGGSVSDCPLRGIDDHFDVMTSSNWLFYPGGELGAHCIPPHDQYDEYSNVDDEDNNNVHDSADPTVGKSIKFGGSGLRSITTRDLCLCEDSVVQFKLAMGCDLDGMVPVVPSSHGSVRFEVSGDHGASWELVEPHCHGRSTSLDTRCGSERRESSIYYPGSFHNWRTIVIPLKNKKHICSQGTNTVRFRWTQGHVDDSVVSWLLDDVYIGAACNESCNGHGICELDEANNPQCACDVGYAGGSCDEFIENSNPAFFFETFDPNAFENSEHHAEYGSNLWYQMSGGTITGSEEECLPNDVVFSRKKFDMFESGSRSLMTVDVDTSSSTFIQFYMKQDSCPGSACEVSSEEPIYLQYSSNGGLYWNNLETFPFDQLPSQSKFHLILLEEDARNTATRFRLWQPSHDGKFRLDWSVDQVVIGRGLVGIDDDFSRNQPDTWIEIIGGKVEATQSCPFDDNHLRLGGLRDSDVDCGHRMATTNGVNVGLGSFLQFTLHADCHLSSGTYSCHDISVEYSLDHGMTWKLVKDACNVDDANCDSNDVGTIYTSDQFDSDGKMNRVVMLLPDSTHSPSTRFRWRLPQSVDDVIWTVDDVYVGRDCPSACFGHGNCHNKVCNCDDGWTGNWCQSPVEKLLTEVKDNFDPANMRDTKRKLYANLVGAEVDAMCGEIGFGRALHFYKNCSRVLVTMPLDTTDADFVQFRFRYGCYGNQPISRDHSVMVEYTPNGGAVWINLAEIYFADYNDHPGFINIFLPRMAKRVGVQFRWKQIKHDGYQHQDWAIDDLHIGGDKRGKYLSDLFVMDDATQLMGKSPEPEAQSAGYGLYLDRDDKDMWRFYDNTRPTSFCGRDNVVLAGTQPGIEASVGTKDFIATEEYILQYTIVVLCEDVQRVHQPVHVQASTDFGDTWEYVVPQCLPSDGDCFGQEIVQPSAHFISENWRRRTIRLAQKFIERPVRFRFIQFNSDVQWALDHFYVGPTCPDACLGHGNCVKEGDISKCVCDAGYSGDNCHLDHQLRTYSKDTFNAEQAIGQLWEIIEAEKLGYKCGQLSDGNAMYFDGVGPRQFVTKELDLQDARFVQYKAVIGADVSTCLPSKNRGDGLLLQYSSDGGISWEMLLELDYQSYRNVGIDYIPLPLDSRTNRTLLRMWQPFIIDRKSGLVQMGFDRASWAVDDVYIGGNDVNTALLQTHLNVDENPANNLGKLPDQMFDFHPKGSVDLDQCGVDGRAIWWPNDDTMTSLTDQSLITRQLIVSKNYLLQFKIRVGCGDVINECDNNFGVHLEYREDPRSNDWKLVREDCYPAAPPNGRCSLFHNYQSSIYTLNKGGRWRRITIPLDHIESSTTQFRWRQRGGASSMYSWSVDDVYVGEACADFCSGHGDCVAPDVCACDDGFDGPTCANDAVKQHHDFKDNFEVPSQRDIALLTSQYGADATFPQKWSAVDGGMMGLGGCGSLRPYGYGRTAYFNGCGMRGLTTVEMDLRRAGHIQYIIQIGSNAPGSQTGCRIYQASGSSGGVLNSNSSVLLQYSTNYGVTWNLIREHLVRHYTSAKRLSIPLTQQMKTVHTTLRWLQPYHSGPGFDQWAIDNVEIVMTRQNRYLYKKETTVTDHGVRSRRTSSSRHHNRRH